MKSTYKNKLRINSQLPPM